MADPPTIQPLVSSTPNSSSSSTSPPVSDLNSLRQKSLQQAQQDLSNRSQSPTGTAAQLLSQTARRNAVDQSSGAATSPPQTQSQSSPAPTQPPTKTVTGQGSAPSGTPTNANGPQATPKPPQSAQNIFTQPIGTFLSLALSQVMRNVLSRSRSTYSSTSNESTSTLSGSTKSEQRTTSIQFTPSTETDCLHFPISSTRHIRSLE